LNRYLKPMLLVLALVAVAMIAKTYFKVSSPFGEGTKQVKYSTFIDQINQGNVIASGTINKTSFDGEYNPNAPGVTGTNRKFSVTLPDAPQANADLIKLLSEKKVTFDNANTGTKDMIMSILSMLLLPMGVVLIFWLIFLRQAQSGGNQALNFGRSKARRLGDNVPKVTFDDVAGVDEAKQDLQEIVEFLRNAKKFQALGAKIPKGVLLLGPPGSGKTLLARAIAGEANVPFFHISGSDFVEMFVGVGASRVRDLFDTAKQNRPALIFIDEIDAVGRQRGAGWGGGHDEREQTLNQLLVEMDGFDPNSGVILIAATNRPDVLDPALLRPGRFDRRVVVDAPDFLGRKAILGVHTRGKPLSEDVNVENLARRTPGFSGADLANLVNEAALLAARREKTRIEMTDFNDSIDRVIMGPERKSRVLSEREREVVAYHELGHAIVQELLPMANPVHKVTILPRGMALGVTMGMPSEDRYLTTRQEFLDNIAAFLGGRVAEEIVFNESTTGASNDLDRATDMARSMVTEYGMSPRLGTLKIGNRSGSPFLGRDMHEDRNYSEEVAAQIDQEVRSIMDDCYKVANDILMENRELLNEIAKVLLEKESIEREEFLKLMQGAKAPAGRISRENPHKDEMNETTPDEDGIGTDGDASQSNRRPLRPRLEPGIA
jgi:cell division protease FtsH